MRCCSFAPCWQTWIWFIGGIGLFISSPSSNVPNTLLTTSSLIPPAQEFTAETAFPIPFFVEHPSTGYDLDKIVNSWTSIQNIIVQGAIETWQPKIEARNELCSQTRYFAATLWGILLCVVGSIESLMTSEVEILVRRVCQSELQNPNRNPLISYPAVWKGCLFLFQEKARSWNPLPKPQAREIAPCLPWAWETLYQARIQIGQGLRGSWRLGFDAVEIAQLYLNPWRLPGWHGW